jgi:hypothetical protein
MKEAMKRLISNETSQDRSLRLKDATTHSAAKILNETLQKRFIRLENTDERYAAEKSSKTSSHAFESSKGQNHHRQDIIKRKSLTTTNETDDQRNQRLKTHRETKQLAASVQQWHKKI